MGVRVRTDRLKCLLTHIEFRWLVRAEALAVVFVWLTIEWVSSANIAVVFATLVFALALITESALAYSHIRRSVPIALFALNVVILSVILIRFVGVAVIGLLFGEVDAAGIDVKSGGLAAAYIAVLAGALWVLWGLMHLMVRGLPGGWRAEIGYVPPIGTNVVPLDQARRRLRSHGSEPLA